MRLRATDWNGVERPRDFTADWSRHLVLFRAVPWRVPTHRPRPCRRGTAVNVQAMAFGNMGETSGTGVCFTRDPNTGAKYLYGEYLINAQGEDVVAGIRTPSPIETLKERLPEAYEELVRNCDILETHYKDMQDIEFTIQDGKLYMLQCRSGKRTGAAALKIAMDLVDEGLVSMPKAITMVEPTHLDQLLHPAFVNEEAYKSDVIAKVGLCWSERAPCSSRSVYL